MRLHIDNQEKRQSAISRETLHPETQIQVHAARGGAMRTNLFLRRVYIFHFFFPHTARKVGPGRQIIHASWWMLEETGITQTSLNFTPTSRDIASAL